MSATSETELVRIQRAKWALLSHALKAQFVVVSGTLTAAVDSGTVSAWLAFGVALVGSVFTIADRWFAEGPLLLRRPERVVVVDPPHDTEAR